MDDSPVILCVGLICLDIINHVDRYPEEDEDIRAKHQTWQSGGNCNNTAKVLALIGRKCEFLGSLGCGSEANYAVEQLDSLGIVHNHCPVYQDCQIPTSYILLNVTNGSRTIVHYRNLPELYLKDFLCVDLSKYSWIHFEGRNPDECCKMIKHIQEHNQVQKVITVSVEIEKTKPELNDLIPLADILIISKEFAKYHGYKDKIEAVTKLRSKSKQNGLIICAWGEKGAAASDENEKIYSSPAFIPPDIKDTLGAGDTFNAGLISSLSSGNTLQESLNYACKLAGTKCGMLGYDGLKTFESQS